MKSTLDTIAFFKTMRATIESMSDEDAGALMKALFAHDDGEEPDLSAKSQIVQVVYPLVTEPLDRLTKIRMSKVRVSANEPQTVRNDTANEPQTKPDAPQTALDSPSHSHSLNHSQNHNHVDDSQAEDWPGRPTVKNVQEWADREGVEIDAIKFVTYYERKNWMTGDTPIKDWRAVARAWAKTERQVKVPDKPPDQPKKPGKYESWLATVDYSDLVAGRAKK